MTITEFLLARVAEDEASYHTEAAGIEWLSVGGRNLWDHLLAESEAKRRIVDRHRLSPRRGVTFTGGVTTNHCWAGCGDQYTDHSYLNWGSTDPRWPCDTIRTLAAVYADHPDYREEWRP